MKTSTGKFLQRPSTPLGWWAVGLALLFVMMFVSATNDLLRLPGMLIMATGVIAGISTLVALIWKRERSWLLWLMLLPGLFAIFFSAGEILLPH